MPPLKRVDAAPTLLFPTNQVATCVALFIRVQKLGDSLRVAERRAVQTVQRADVLDRVLRLERRMRDSLRVAVDRLRRQARSDSVVADAEDNERRAAFDVRAAPYTVHADVVLPRAPRRGSMDVRVDVDRMRWMCEWGAGWRRRWWRGPGGRV